LVISKTSRSLTTCGCRIILCRWYSRVAIRTYEALRHCDQLLSTRCTLHATCGAQRQFLYFCTSKASKLSIRRYCDQLLSTRCTLHATCGAQRQRLYFCTSKASKLSTSDCGQSVSCRAAGAELQRLCCSSAAAATALLQLCCSVSDCGQSAAERCALHSVAAATALLQLLQLCCSSVAVSATAASQPLRGAPGTLQLSVAAVAALLQPLDSCVIFVPLYPVKQVNLVPAAAPGDPAPDTPASFFFFWCA
jgi:hypothetical protein